MVAKEYLGRRIPCQCAESFRNAVWRTWLGTDSDSTLHGKHVEEDAIHWIYSWGILAPESSTLTSFDDQVHADGGTLQSCGIAISLAVVQARVGHTDVGHLQTSIVVTGTGREFPSWATGPTHSGSVWSLVTALEHHFATCEGDYEEIRRSLRKGWGPHFMRHSMDTLERNYIIGDLKKYQKMNGGIIIVRNHVTFDHNNKWKRKFCLNMLKTKMVSDEKVTFVITVNEFLKVKLIISLLTK